MNFILHFLVLIAAGAAVGTFVLVFEAITFAIVFLDLTAGC